MNNNRLHLFFLFLTAFLWGTTFVAQRIGAEYVGPWTYLALRSWVAVLFLTPVISFRDWTARRRGTVSRRPRNSAERKYLLFAGILCGLSLGAASLVQQIGIAATTASKTGFITSLYVVIVPLMSIVVKKKPEPQIWAGVLLALLGLYLLCMTAESFSLQTGDAWVLACAFLFALEIMIVDHYSPLVDTVRLSRIQFLVIGLCSTVPMLLIEAPDPESLRLGLPAILYAGIFSSGIAFTLQIVGQEGVNPTLASLVMSLEGVFSALTGWAVLHERLTGRELLGCVLIFIAITLAQVNFRALFRRRPGSSV